jgi:nucleoside-diphosphate-sugar epimerase
MEEPDESKEPEVRILNNTKIVEALNLSKDAFTDLKEGLKQTVEWYKSGN